MLMPVEIPSRQCLQDELACGAKGVEEIPQGEVNVRERGTPTGFSKVSFSTKPAEMQHEVKAPGDSPCQVGHARCVLRSQSKKTAHCTVVGHFESFAGGLTPYRVTHTPFLVYVEMVICHPQFMNKETQVQRRPFEDPGPLSCWAASRNTFCPVINLGPSGDHRLPLCTCGPMWPPHAGHPLVSGGNLSNYFTVVGLRG